MQKDYEVLIEKVWGMGIEVVFDFVFQCVFDYFYIKEYLEWFVWCLDGIIVYVENLLKKYQDIVLINFEIEDWKNFWEEFKSVVIYWCEVGICIFCVDNLYIKFFCFWEWCIVEVQKYYFDIIFLVEAFI